MKVGQLSTRMALAFAIVGIQQSEGC
ncbi:hypothetical protein LINPERPRIM_LOCUS40867 [Linum perenne]